MTYKQEAIRMIKNMPDETVGILVELFKQMTAKESFPAGDSRIQPSKRRLGIADGMYDIPDDIDACNDEIAAMFGVTE